MKTITYNQVEALLKQLPEAKLQIAYRLLADLAARDNDSLSFRQKHISLPLNERRQIMAQQAEQLITHYQNSSDERKLWQEGDFLEDYSARGDMDS